MRKVGFGQSGCNSHPDYENEAYDESTGKWTYHDRPGMLPPLDSSQALPSHAQFATNFVQIRESRVM
jgi:hypothetical protein